MYFTTYNSQIGAITLVSDGESLKGLWLDQQKLRPNFDNPDYQNNSSIAIFDQAKNWLNQYFNGKNPNPSQLKLSPDGTEFQRAIWKILTNIGYGQTRNYGEITALFLRESSKTTMSNRAVGGAIGRNPISIIIPCHRVVSKSSKLTGYAGGLDAKRALLQLEGIELSNFRD